MNDESAWHLDATEAADLIQAGKLSSAALTGACLERIARREAEIEAWETLDAARARSQAQGRDREGGHGLLHGIPVAVKDIIDVAGLPTRYGSPIHAHAGAAASDAACVAAARRAGAVILGKTVTTEFAGAAPGKTRNPLNLAHTPGGSSSGSAACVADGMAPLAFGTQTAGSIIRPAAYCGIVGFKPSFGWMDRGGVGVFAPSLDTIGLFSRTVADVARFFAALTGRPQMPSAGRGPIRIGRLSGPPVATASALAEQAVAASLTKLSRHGADIVDVAPPASLVTLAASQHRVMAYETNQALLQAQQEHPALLSDKLQELLALGASISRTEHEAALGLALEARQAFAAAMVGVDALIMPPALGIAPNGLQDTGDPVFCRVWSLLHFPALTLPVLRDENGLSVGVQLVGAPVGDDRLLAVAHVAGALDEM
jgi:amidase